MNKMCIVVPCYDESEVLSESAAILLEKIQKLIKGALISKDSRVLFVDDGSKDDTWDIITRLNHDNKYFEGCKLSRNFGHQNALIAGISSACERFDSIVTIDADLQDDVNVIDDFAKQYNKGFEVVYGVRNNRKSDSFFKRTSANIFYAIIRALGCDIIPNHADCRLMSARAVKELLEFHEVNLFLRGLVPKVGFKSTKVYYKRKERTAGESKYPLKKMINFAFDGITSFCVKPIRLITRVGVLCVILGVLMFIYTIISHIIGNTYSGWSSLMISIWTLGGLQIFSIGIVGEYISKIYLETKRRPRFIVEKNLYNETK